MAHCYVAPITRIPEKDVFLVRVPEGTTLQAGAIVDLLELDSAIPNNYQVYEAQAPAADAVNHMLGIVINDGWEQLADGRRPDGQPDYTQYEYQAGDVVCVVALEKYMRFEISEDALDTGATPTVGEYLDIQDGDFALTSSETGGVFRVEAEKFLRAGGQFGGSLTSGFIPTLVCVVAYAQTQE